MSRKREKFWIFRGRSASQLVESPVSPRLSYSNPSPQSLNDRPCACPCPPLSSSCSSNPTAVDPWQRPTSSPGAALHRSLAVPRALWAAALAPPSYAPHPALVHVRALSPVWKTGADTGAFAVLPAALKSPCTSKYRTLHRRVRRIPLRIVVYMSRLRSHTTTCVLPSTFSLSCELAVNQCAISMRC